MQVLRGQILILQGETLHFMGKTYFETEYSYIGGYKWSHNRESVFDIMIFVCNLCKDYAPNAI